MFITLATNDGRTWGHRQQARTRPEQMLYVYRLEGGDGEWHSTAGSRVEYTDLTVGQYVFQARAVDRDLNYSDVPAEVLVRVHRPGPHRAG